MKTYTALVRAYVGKTLRVVPTEVRAMSSSDAKWMLQAIFGFHAVLSSPTELHESTIEAAIKPLTPDQQRVKSLKANKDRATDALKRERDRQKHLTASKAMSGM